MSPATRAARWAVTAVFLVHGTIFGSWVARIPALVDGLGIDKAELGLALFCASVGALLAMPLAGLVTSRLGSRQTTAVATLAFCALLPAVALAPSLAWFALVLFAYGAIAGSMDVAMNAHGVAVERALGRPVISSFHAAFSAGGLLGAGGAALAALVDAPPTLHFATVAVLLGLLSVPALRALLPAAADAADGPAFVRPPRRLLAVGLIVFCAFVAEGAAGDWSALLIDESIGASTAVAALGFAAFSVTMMLGRLVGDRVVERVGPVALVRGGGLLGAAGLGVAITGDSAALAVLGLALMGAGLAAIVPVGYRAGGTTPGVPAGTGIAAVTTIGYTGFLVGPPTVGAIAEATTLPIALGVVVALQAVLALLAPAARTAEDAPLPRVAVPERLP